MQNPQDVQLAADALAARAETAGFAATGGVGLILGTGLSSLGDELKLTGGMVPYASLPGFPLGSVQSHAGAFAFGHISGMPVLAQLGRCHLYEGKTPAEVCMGCRVMASLGVKTLIVTNAAGALNPLFDAGSLMLIVDQINHTGLSPLTGANHDAWGERFPDMSRPFDPGLAALAAGSALDLGIRLEKGVYIGVHGPEMETPAETRMYRQWGADAIGMSSVLEVIAARHLGLKVLGISCLTNKNLPDNMAPAPIAEVIRMASIAGASLARLLKAICGKLASGPEGA